MSKVYLGVGLTSPMVLSNAGVWATQSEEALVIQSIQRILTTPVGFRLMLPEYGSRLHQLKFEQNDSVLKALLERFIRESIEKWEKRCKFVSVETSLSNDVAQCSITCRILASNEVFSFIFPFYRQLAN